MYHLFISAVLIFNCNTLTQLVTGSMADNSVVMMEGDGDVS